MNHPKLIRVLSVWALTAVGALSLTNGCDKGTPDKPATPPSAEQGKAGYGSVGVVDTQKLLDSTGWTTEKMKDDASLKSSFSREIESYRLQLKKLIEEKKASISRISKLNPQQIDDLNRERDLDKLPITREQLTELATVLQNANGNLQGQVETANRIASERQQAVGKMYSDALSPVVRRVAQGVGLQTIIPKQVAIYSDNAIDLTDKVVDELQKSPPARNFPPIPSLNLPTPTLQDSPLTRPTTGPVAPSLAPTTTSSTR